jgi:hypothetical protein
MKGRSADLSDWACDEVEFRGMAERAGEIKEHIERSKERRTSDAAVVLIFEWRERERERERVCVCVCFLQQEKRVKILIFVLVWLAGWLSASFRLLNFPSEIGWRDSFTPHQTTPHQWSTTGQLAHSLTLHPSIHPSILTTGVLSWCISFTPSFIPPSSSSSQPISLLYLREFEEKIIENLSAKYYITWVDFNWIKFG